MSRHDPEAFVATPLGRLHVWASDERSLHAATMTADQKRQPDYHHDQAARDCAEHLLINGIRYSLYLHLVRADHPSLHQQPAISTPLKGWAVPGSDGALRLRRADNDLLPGTEAAVNRIHTLIVPILADWAASAAGTVVRLRAEANQTEAQITQIHAAIVERQQELLLLQQHRRDVGIRLAIAASGERLVRGEGGAAR